MQAAVIQRVLIFRRAQEKLECKSNTASSPECYDTSPCSSQNFAIPRECEMETSRSGNQMDIDMCNNALLLPTNAHRLILEYAFHCIMFPLATNSDYLSESSIAKESMPFKRS